VTQRHAPSDAGLGCNHKPDSQVQSAIGSYIFQAYAGLGCNHKPDSQVQSAIGSYIFQAYSIL